MDIQTNFSKVLRQKRLEAGLSQEKFAEKVGVSMRTISLLETSKQRPTLPTLENIAKALDVKLSELLQLVESQGD